ncbi:MAG: sodium:solute symporter family protein [Gemmatimonadales bacterium]|jgi:SSS family solute:Na+ symporter
MIDAVVLIVYLCAMVLVGWRSRGRSAESYWVADRNCGTPRISVSLIATTFGASSTIGIIGLGYSRGLTAAWWSLVGAIALLPFGFVLAARVRALRVYTLPDIIEHAYGKQVSVPAATMIVVAWCGVVAAQMIAGARLISGVMALEYSLALAVVAVVFVLYTFWGGQLSVLRTDIWQLGLFLAALAICAAFVIRAFQADGGSVLGSVPDGHFSFPVSDSFGWYELLVFYPLIVGLPYLVGPDIYSRILCARNNSVAKRSTLISAMAIVPISLMLALLGTLLTGLYPGLGQDTALPTAIRELVPIGLSGVVTAGFLAAIMSSADTTLVSAATILSLNVVGAHRAISEDVQLPMTKIALLCVGFAAWLIAGFQQGIISSLLLAYTVFVGGVVFPTLASFYRERLRITPKGAMWAVVVGGTAAILGEINDGSLLAALFTEHGDALLRQLLGPSYTSILPIVLSLLIMVTVSWATSTSTRSAPSNE